jgi:hypothetical protein
MDGTSGDLEQLLRDAGARFEPEVKRRLDGMLGNLVRVYLPQAWVFRTDVGTAALLVDRNGGTSVPATVPEHPDVTVEIPYARLSVALKTGRRDAVPPGPLTVTPHTTKGRAAFDYLRDRIGL